MTEDFELEVGEASVPPNDLLIKSSASRGSMPTLAGCTAC